MTWNVARQSGAVSFANWPSTGSEPASVAMLNALSGKTANAPGAITDNPGGQASSGNGLNVFPAATAQNYEQLLNQFPMMVQVIDGDGIISGVNEECLNKLGYSRREIIGKHTHEILDPASVARLQDTILPAYFESGYFSDEELVMIDHAGEPVNVSMSGIGFRDDTGRITRSVAVFNDITRRADALNELSKSEQRFRGSFESAVHGMAILSVDGRLAAVNNALTEILGFADHQLLAMGLIDFVVAEDVDKVRAEISRLINGDVPSVCLEIQYCGEGGRPVHGLTSVSPVHGQDGRVEQFVVQIVDMTRRIKAESQLLQAQKMDAIGQLTGGIAHDFNNLLTIVIGNLQLIEGAVGNDDKTAKRIAEAISAATKGSQLTRQLLAFARRQSLVPQQLGIHGLLVGMMDILEHSIGERIELKLDMMQGAPVILADATQLETSILNLAINARDAMPDGGLLTVETASVHLDADYAAQHQEVTPGDYIMIAVSDTGTGIPKDILDQVFQPFFTTKEVGKGTGLGLSMVFGFIKQSGGHARIYSEDGHGTSVKMYLPVVKQLTGTPPAPEEKSAKNKILVVEDQEAVRMVAVEFLTSFGYQVIEAQDGVSALQMLQDHPDIDLLFTDVVMPGGMNGFDLSQAAAQLRPALKIIHASGYPKGAMVHQEEPRLKDNLISKPYQREELRRIVAETLEK